MPEGQYDADAVESKWQDAWVKQQTYTYDRDAAVENGAVFSIDTPPPTVSGHLHMGHLYGATLQDFVARFRRMNGNAVFFPFGYDDNGIASERLTERELDIRHQDFSRREFQEKCRTVCQQYEDDFTAKMQALALSMDWSNTYKTIEPRVQRISQLSFLDLYEKGREYRQKAPAIWCPDCETAISQVEMEDAEKHSHFNDLTFPLVNSEESITISTTRPELLPACVAIFVHPDDERSDELVGQEAEVPLFGQEVPILADERVEMEKGSGLVMCCTFGDQTDIEWYQAHGLPLRIAIDPSGHMTDVAGKYEGLRTTEARQAMLEDLEAEDFLEAQDPITHTVQVHERCGTEIEFLVTKQWYIKVLDKKEDYLEAGESMDWYPEKMFTRYKHWIEGLQWDWCISRQRDSGIPFPVWYCANCDEPVFAEKDDLPVDPLEDEPPVETCPSCGHEDGFVAEEDVFDTWATSSLTPLINAHWDWDGDEEAIVMGRPELYPLNLRPQGHDIISFWLFHTIVKCLEHTGEVPFDSVMINGMVLDEHKEKMSKSKGNVVAPDDVLQEFPVDAARYWAAGTSIGDDFPFKEKDLVTGQKLMTKLWNASKLVDDLTPNEPVDAPAELEQLDAWLLAELDELIVFMTEQLQDYGFAKARNRLREFFWNTFCDNYLEITKQRLADEENTSAVYTLQQAHTTFLKLFAPFLVHITEELWDELAYVDTDGSIHRADWPTPRGVDTDLAAGEAAMELIHGLRKYKSDNNLAPTAALQQVQVYGPSIDGFESAVKEAMHITSLDLLEQAPSVETRITEIKLNYAEVGPTYGGKVSEMEADLDEGAYDLGEGVLQVAGEELSADEFEVREERQYEGEGVMVETEQFVLIIQQ